MTAPGAAPGERFRRRALKRGYKVDEVDDFLERVEDSLSGRTRGGAVTADDVREVVFRVRFGGYDEWQVDKHLDRIERQLEDLAEAALADAAPVTEDRPTQVVPAIRDGRRAREEDDGRRGTTPALGAGTTYGGAPAPSFGDDDVSWAGRHGKSDMTMEMPQYGPGSPFTPGDATRIGELRSAFKPRRFGSGYDPREVDRLFDGIAAVVTGRSGGPIDAGDLDGTQFALVQGGYFEDEVDAALREVREIIARGQG
ncbi:MAG TPA: DivIVA domain-containing protein [Mycobacteriales bacterium]|jgi:DivIVA domain-containing protein